MRNKLECATHLCQVRIVKKKSKWKYDEDLQTLEFVKK